jgi:hypothetical protein
MPRVVPSQVVRLVDALFPRAAERDVGRQDAFQLSRDNRSAGKLMAIITLVDQIPNELIALDAHWYSALTVAIAEIKYAIDQWQSHDYLLKGISGFDNLNPVTLIHQALDRCPDEYPSPGIAELPFIPDQKLRDSLRLDTSATNSALGNGEWKAATVLAGSVVEALLLWALQQYPLGDVSTAVSTLVANGTLGNHPGRQLEKWTLASYIEVALALDVIDTETATQARLTKDFRNLIHPGRSQRLGQTCDRATALSAVAAGNMSSGACPLEHLSLHSPSSFPQRVAPRPSPLGNP